MDWDVVDVKVVGDDTLHVSFRDGVEGEVRFLPSFFRGVFSDLKSSGNFGYATVVDGVVVWPGDLDIAPDAMHRRIKADGVWEVG